MGVIPDDLYLLLKLIYLKIGFLGSPEDNPDGGADYLSGPVDNAAAALLLRIRNPGRVLAVTVKSAVTYAEITPEYSRGMV